MKDKQEFTFLKEVRRIKKKSAQEVANVCGFSQSYISAVENGQKYVSTLNILRIIAGIADSEKEEKDILDKFNSLSDGKIAIDEIRFADYRTSYRTALKELYEAKIIITRVIKLLEETDERQS